MGWVTLACRSKEDLSVKNYYQYQLLCISREQRATARAYQLEQTITQNDQDDELSDLKSQYNSTKSEYKDNINFGKELKAIVKKNEDGETLTSDEQELLDSMSGTAFDGMTSDQIEAEIDILEDALSDIQEQYQEDVNEVKDLYDVDLSMIEEAANDEDTMYQSMQTDLETQYEAVSSELETVKDSTSSEIQDNVIRLT